MKQTSKTSITHTEFLQITGLLTLAAKHGKMLEDIRKSLVELTGEEDEFGHCSDAIYATEPYSPEDLLKRLDLVVAARSGAKGEE